MGRFQTTHRSTGLASADFATPEEAFAAVEKHEQQMGEYRSIQMPPFILR